LKQGLLVERHRFPEIKECFYTITPSRKFPTEIVRELIHQRPPIQARTITTPANSKLRLAIHPLTRSNVPNNAWTFQ